ncbi:hypothetical protein HY025_03325 [Candidatus Daviesbacteria bacterium]|nr:hypothetical protein [Candidatus Daviesbacteria bacterium]
MKCNWSGVAKYLNVSPRAFENWYRGRHSLPEDVFIKLNYFSKVSIHNPKILSDNWGQVKGGYSNIKLHGYYFGTAEGRKKGGMNSIAKISHYKVFKKFPMPNYSEKLAEFVGIMLGDGGISKDQISITIGYSTDFEYMPFLIKLIKSLFKANASTYKRTDSDAVTLRVSGVNLVKNLLMLGLVQGNKMKQENFNIPAWVLESNSYIESCIRSLIDTDGCVFRKVRREKTGVEYRSIGIKFTTASNLLRTTLINMFNILGFKVAPSGRDLYLSGKRQIDKYINEIGFSNPKHSRRYKNFIPEYGWKKFNPKFV